MKNDLFHYLTSRNIFKGWYRTNKASEKTEQRRAERHRGVIKWLSVGQRINPQTQLKERFGRGTYIAAKHGQLK